MTIFRKFAKSEKIPKDSVAWRIDVGFVCLKTEYDSILGIWGEGDIINPGTIAPNYFMCLTDTTIASTTPDSEAFLKHIKQINKYLEIAYVKPQKNKLLAFLKHLAERFGEDKEEGRQINLQIPHHVLADAIGTTRVTITKTLAELKKENFIERSKDHKIIVLKNAQLKN